MKRNVFLFVLAVAISLATADDNDTKFLRIDYNGSMATRESQLSSTDDILLLAGELEIDEHATDARNVVKRSGGSSFLPQQHASSAYTFRDLLNHHQDENAVRYAAPAPATYGRPHKKSDAHQKMPFRYTREVQIKQGRIVGIVREMSSKLRLKNVDQYLGIPYAEAPVDSRRFMPPSPPLVWQGVKYANKMGDVCPQKLPNLADSNGFSKGRYDQIKRLLPFLSSESEDCLYLNLYVTSYGERLSNDLFKLFLL